MRTKTEAGWEHTRTKRRIPAKRMPGRVFASKISIQMVVNASQVFDLADTP